MKKAVYILTPILSATWLILLFLVPGNVCTQYAVTFFSAVFRGEGSFWGFLISPFVAMFFSAIASLVCLVTAFTRTKSIASSVVWNGYLVLQLLIHLHDFYGADSYLGYAARDYYIFTGVLGAVYLLLIAVYVVRCRIEYREEKEEALRYALEEANESEPAPTEIEDELLPSDADADPSGSTPPRD